MTREQIIENLKDIKIKVTPEQSKVVQETVFKLGWKWAIKDKQVSYVDSLYLFLSSMGFITYANYSSTFEQNPFKNITFEEFVNITKEEINLVELLKGCPVGTPLYSDVFGDVTFWTMYPSCEYSIGFIIKDGTTNWVTSKGLHYKEHEGSCTLWPSRDKRTWDDWVCPKPDLPIDTPVMIGNTKNDFMLRYYAGNKSFWARGYKSIDEVPVVRDFKYIIPFDKFNPQNIEDSLKYNICK